MKTVFRRYNPSAFKSGGRKQNPGVSRRRGVLLRWLCYFKTTVPEDFVTVAFLYYGGYEEGKPLATKIL